MQGVGGFCVYGRYKGDGVPIITYSYFFLLIFLNISYHFMFVATGIKCVYVYVPLCNMPGYRMDLSLPHGDK